jgi:hypothetical protein
MADATKTPDTPKPAVAAKKPGLEDEAGDARAKKPAKIAPSSGRSLGRAIIVASLFVTIAWVFASATQARYQLVPVPTQENTFIYRLDQRTGAVHICSSQQCTELSIRSGS